MLAGAALLAITAVWGWTFVLVHDAVRSFGVVAFLALRFLLATAILAPAARGRFRRATLTQGGGIGLVLAAGYLLQTWGLRHTTPTSAGLITGLFVVFAPLADRWLYGTQLRAAARWAIAASLAGLWLLAGGGAPALRRGDALVVGCAVAYGCHVALLSRHASRHDPLALTCVQLGTAAAVFSLAWPAVDPLVLPADPAVWVALGVTATLASALAYLVQTWAQRRLSAAQTAVILTAEPVFAALFGYALAGDRLTPVQLTGGALILAAVAIVEVLPKLGQITGKTRGTAEGRVDPPPPATSPGRTDPFDPGE
jgi:drug/metabolite transporter (DMT)-like permease